MKIYVKYALLAFWLAFIFYLSSEGSDTSSERSGAIVEVVRTVAGSLPTDILTFLTRKVAHIIAYLILGVLMYVVVRAHSKTTRRAVLASIAFVALYAISDEMHQLFVPGRSGEVRDVLIDSVAGTIGVGVTYLVARSRTSKKVKNDV